MTDDADARWSAAAEVWSRHWTSFLPPLWQRLADAVPLRAGTRVLDVGTGSGELLHWAADRGLSAAGAEPAAGMRALAARVAPGSDVRAGSWEGLPWPDDSFDAVTAVNALQFADDLDAALAEAARVLSPAGRLAIANWAEQERNDLHVIEQAIADWHEDEVAPDDELRLPGGLAHVLGAAGWRVVDEGALELPWRLTGDIALVEAFLGTDPDLDLAPVVLEAAAPFRRDGGYELVNGFRYAVAEPSLLVE